MQISDDRFQAETGWIVRLVGYLKSKQICCFVTVFVTKYKI
jgi:hypothetical protein